MAAGGPQVGRELAGPNSPAGRAQKAAAQESMSVADRLPGRCTLVTGERRKVFAWRSRGVSLGWGHANKAVEENPSPARLLGSLVGFDLRLLLAGSVYSPRSAGLEYQSGFVDVDRGIWCGLCH